MGMSMYASQGGYWHAQAQEARAEADALRKDAERYRAALVECAEAFEALDVGGGIDARVRAVLAEVELQRPSNGNA